MKTINKKIGIVCGMCGCRHEGELYFLLSFGRVIDELAARYEKVFLCVSLKNGFPDKLRDYRLQAENVEIIQQPFFTSSLRALRHPVGFFRAYAHVCRKADALFIRGMSPFVGSLYANAWLHKRSVCHWIVGNPIALLQTHKRSGRIVDILSLAYAHKHRIFTRLGRWLVDGSFVCNGRELGESYKSPRTISTVSSTVREDEFFERQDTCQRDKIRMLFIGFIRPEKGLEYLIEAVCKLKTKKPWEIVLVGPREKFSTYGEKLEQLIDSFDIRQRVQWAGYVSYGPEMFNYLREADIFVFPTLSEGTPRALVEARANSLPIVATNVGGIPTSVTHGYDGLLVPPKNPDALAKAIDRVISDGELRRLLIRNGLRSAHQFTIGRFADVVVDELEKLERKRE